MKNPRLILLLVLAVWSALPSLAQDDTCPYLECRYTSQAKFNALNKDKVNPRQRRKTLWGMPARKPRQTSEAGLG